MFSIVDRSSVGSGQPYTITFKNDSSNNWSFVCFQQQPSGLPQNYVTLAWFSMPAAPDTKIIFKWTIDYALVWGQTGKLQSGVVFDASQTRPTIGLSKENDITFHREPNGAFNFVNQGDGPSGSLVIEQDDTIPSDTASVGIAMSGVGTFAVPAQPNIKATFVPTPTYYVAFGQSIQQGEVLNISQFTSIAQVKFGPNKYDVNATLGQDNRWTISDKANASDVIAALRASLA